VRLSDVEQVVVQDLLTLGFAVETEDEPALIKELLFIARGGPSLDYRKARRAAVRGAAAIRAHADRAHDRPSELQAVSESWRRTARTSAESTGFPRAAGVVSSPFAAGRRPSASSAPCWRRGGGAFDCGAAARDPARRSKRLIVMDMDSTLIGIEVIDELAARTAWELRSGHHPAAMTGEMDYDQSLRERVACSRARRARPLRAGREPSLTEGAETLLRVLQRLGYRTAVISGGFSVAAEALQKRLGIDAWSNTLEIEGGV